MYGLTAAAVLGVPGMQWLSELAGWRVSYAVVTAVGIAGLALMWAYVPSIAGTASGGNCPPDGGQPTGGATPKTPVTFCCTK